MRLEFLLVPECVVDDIPLPPSIRVISLLLEVYCFVGNKWGREVSAAGMVYHLVVGEYLIPGQRKPLANGLNVGRELVFDCYRHGASR